MWFYSVETFLVLASLFFFSWSLRKEVHLTLFHKLVGWAGFLVLLSALFSFDFRGVFFQEVYVMDGFSQLMKVILVLGYFITLFLAQEVKDVDGKHQPEFYLFLTTSTLGMVVLVSAKDLITLYTALELASYSLYLLIPMRSNGKGSAEASIKYILIGIAASGIMVYGFSLLFGLTQTTYLNEIAAQLPLLYQMPIFWVAFFFSLAGFFFKLSFFPFHAWTPDVYEAGNTQVIGFISTVSKIAGLSVLIRFMLLAGETAHVLDDVWVAIAIATMTIGNLSALIQKDLKRLLAYSSIAQAGYLLVGVLCISEKGISGAIYYAAAYLVMNLTAFFIISQLSKNGNNVPTSAVKGLFKRSPLLALTLLISFFALAGIPPLAGFTGKWFIFSAAVNSGYNVLALVAIFNSIISLYYYLMVVKDAYSDEGIEAGGLEPIRLKPAYQIYCYLSIAVLVVTGFFPHLFMSLTKQSIAVFF